MVEKKDPYAEIEKMRKKLGKEEPRVFGKEVDILTGGAEGGFARRKWKKMK